MLAINGLRGTNLRIELLTKHGLDWDELKRLVKARSLATHTVDVLVKNFDCATINKSWRSM